MFNLNLGTQLELSYLCWIWRKCPLGIGVKLSLMSVSKCYASVEQTISKDKHKFMVRFNESVEWLLKDLYFIKYFNISFTIMECVSGKKSRHKYICF